MSMLFKRIKDWATSIITFRTGDVIPVDGPSGTAKMSKDDLLATTAQNTLAENIAPAFDPGVTYYERDLVSYNGKLYVFKKTHTGEWNASHVYSANSADMIGQVMSPTGLVLTKLKRAISYGGPNLSVSYDAYNNQVVSFSANISGWTYWGIKLGIVGELKNKFLHLYADNLTFMDFSGYKTDSSSSTKYWTISRNSFVAVGSGVYRCIKQMDFGSESDESSVYLFCRFYNPSSGLVGKFSVAIDSEPSAFGSKILDNYKGYISENELNETFDSTGLLLNKVSSPILIGTQNLSVTYDSYNNQVASCSQNISGWADWGVKLGTVGEIKNKKVSFYTDNTNFSFVSLSKSDLSSSTRYWTANKLAFSDLGNGIYRFSKSFDFSGESDASKVYAKFYLQNPSSGSVGKFFVAVDGGQSAFDTKSFKYNEQTDALLIKQVSSNLYKKGIWCLCDSLGENTWQSYLVSSTGCNFSSAKNIDPLKPITKGGTTSMPADDGGTQARAINLVSYKDTDSIDYVFIENINDRNVGATGSITDKPFMRSICKQIVVPQSEPSISDWVSSNWSTIVSDIGSSDKKKGYILKFVQEYSGSTRGSKITFSGSVATEGNITISLNGSTFGVHVTVGMTLTEVVDACLQYNYGPGWTDVRTGVDSFKIYYYENTSVRATVNTGSTGLVASVEDAAGSNIWNLFYEGETSLDFDTYSNWSHSDRTLYSTYKGLIEYLQTELPKAKIFFFIPWAFGLNFSSTTFKNDDGTWSQDKFKSSTTYSNANAINEVQKEVAKFYGIPVLDMFKDGEMSIINVETYFYTSNVHPKNDGYSLYASYIASKV